LDLSRVGRIINPPTDVPFEDIVWQALKQAEGILKERQVQLQVATELPVVHVDRTRVVQVIQNLVANAVKFMGDQNNPVIEIGIEKGNDQPTFFVRDNGIGIEHQYHEQIFGLFNKLDISTEGTGIGLGLAKRIIEMHGGRIWVESHPGKGSTFFFTLENKTH
jgi:light-regulated signal transduction histidine kinase (bacteriophytochrome)